MTLIEPWDYQKSAVALVWKFLHGKKKVLVVSPGGSGKTVMISQQTGEALKRGSRRVLIISHRKEIIDQTRLTLSRMGFASKDVGVLVGGVEENLGASVVVASMMSLIRRRTPIVADDVIVDEAHHALADGYASVLRRFNEARHTGYTATPFRQDGRGLGDFYEEMIVAALPSALIERQRLACPIIYRAPVKFMPTLDGLRIIHGDYILNELEDRVNTRELVGNVVENYIAHASGKRAICFAVNIKHSRFIVQNFTNAKIPAAHVDGTMPVEEREQILTDFRDGKLLVVSNCMVLSEGYDLPTCEAVIMARPTQSLTLYIQQASRGLRYLPNKRPIILDHACGLETFGLPEADRHYVLTRSKTNKALWNAGPVKDCPNCGACIAAGLRYCPNCSHEFPNVVRGIPTETDDMLERYAEADRADFERRVLETYGDTSDSQKLIAAYTSYRTPLKPHLVIPPKAP